MNKEKQIEDMARAMHNRIYNCTVADCINCELHPCLCYKFATEVYNKGYRKQSDMAKKFVAGVTVELSNQTGVLYSKDIILAIINKVAAKFGTEVEQ